MGSLQVYTSYTPLNKELFPIAWQNEKSIGIDISSYNYHTGKENKHRIFLPKYMIKNLKQGWDDVPHIPTNIYNEKITSITLNNPDVVVVQDKGFKTSEDMLKYEKEQADWEAGREERGRQEREYVPDNIKKLNTISEVEDALKEIERRREANSNYYEYSDAINAYSEYERTEKELDREEKFLLKRKEQLGESKSINKVIAGKIMNTVVEQAKVCNKVNGYDIEIIIYSDDHLPAHAHVFDLNKNELGQIELTDKQPESIDDIITYKGNLSTDTKRKILDWSKHNNKYGLNNWVYSLSIWETYEQDK